MRINKYLSSSGFCSRREADRLLEQGKITIDGKEATVGTQVEEGQVVCVDGKIVGEQKQERILIAFNKPRGIVCTSSKKDKNNIIDYIQYPTRIYPVGRLDKESTGLILLTNDGELMDCILRGKNGHEKEYLVTVNRPLKPQIIQAMEQGVPILNTVTRPCHIQCLEAKKFKIILKQGLNRQIRRMCEYFGYRVISLQRIRIMNIHLGDLPEGTWRKIEGNELAELEQALKGQKFYNESNRKNETTN